MFYSSGISRHLRMGDIVRGFILGAARQEIPKIDPHDFQVSLRSPSFTAILTPCCSIGEKTLALAPLVRVQQSWLRNPYFKTDLTNINRIMLPEQTVSSEVWQKLGEEEKRRRLETGKSYALVEWFIYPPNDIFIPYKLKYGDSEVEVAYYAIDFRSLHRVECDAVVNVNQVPITAKVLELEPTARAELRNKLSSYFGRPPHEDDV